MHGRPVHPLTHYLTTDKVEGGRGLLVLFFSLSFPLPPTPLQFKFHEYRVEVLGRTN